jgi:DNA-binding MarR family transcriptional regulator
MKMSRSERIVLKFLEQHGQIEISLLNLGVELGLTDKTVTTAVRRLERSGRVQVERGRGRLPNRYRI